MANYTPPASFSTSHTANTTSQVPSSSTLAPEISPSIFDTLPILTTILTRLQASTSNSNTSTAATTTQSANLTFPQSTSPHVSQSQTLSAVTAAGSTSSPFATASVPLSKDGSQSGPLSTKDIPAETDELRARLKRARAMVAALPDIQRDIREQEVEIRELEMRIEEQRSVLQGLKAVGGQAGIMET